MQTTAQGYLVFELTKSPAYLGYVGFAAGIPVWLFTLYGGVIADRMPRRKLLIITQTAMMILAIILAILTFTNLIQPWQIIVLAFMLGIANAFDAPARQAFVTELVDREDLTNAIALNSTMFNAATVLGPAIAGITYAAFGPEWCFTINAISFLAVIIALSQMRLPAFQMRPKYNSLLGDIRQGFTQVLEHPMIRVIILNLAILSLFGLGFITLMPAWAVNVLGGNAETNGLLQSARGLGALIGALMIAYMGHYQNRGKLFTLGGFLMPIFLLIFSATRVLPLSMLTLMGVGFGFMVMINISNSLVQTSISDELRGRVMGIYTLVFFGLMPIGSLINGVLATHLTTPVTVALNALVLLGAAGLIFLRVPNIRKQA